MTTNQDGAVRALLDEARVAGRRVVLDREPPRWASYDRCGDLRLCRRARAARWWGRAFRLHTTKGR